MPDSASGPSAGILRNRFFRLALLLCFPASVFGQAHPLMTVDNAVAIGLKNNFNILLAKNQEAVASNDYSYAFGAFLPSLNGTAIYSGASNDLNQKYATGTVINRNGATSTSLTLEANLNWTLFDGLKVFAEQKQFALIKSEDELEVKNEVNTMVGAILAAYYNVVQLTQDLQSILELEDISQQRLDIATRQFNVGSGSKQNVLQAEVDLNTEKEAFLLQQSLIDEAKASLNQVIAIPGDSTSYSVTDSIPVDLSLGYQDLKNTVFNTNLPLQVMEKNVEIANQEVHEAQAARYPVVVFDPNYTYSLAQSQAGFAIYNLNKGLTWGFTATIPIFNQLNNVRLVKDARLNMAYQQLTVDSQRNYIGAGLQGAYDSYDYYKKVLVLDQQNRDVAQENLQVALATFQQGQNTMVDVRVAEQSLEDALYKLTTDRYNVKVAEIALDQLLGTLVR